MLKDGMDSLFNCGIQGKLYRLIFEMNKSTMLSIKIGCGTTQPVQIGANIAQGSIGGALISSVNLDKTMNQFFSKSEHEISYFDLRLQPTIFQDDISRLSSSRVSAQTGNIFVSSCMESKLLDLNVDKSCFIIIGNTSYTQDLRNEIKQYPLQLCGIMMKEKTTDKYLGDLITSDCKINYNIEERYNKGIGISNHIIILLKEIYFGQHYFEMGVLFRQSMLINGIRCNSEVLYGLNKSHIERLESVDDYL